MRRSWLHCCSLNKSSRIIFRQFPDISGKPHLSLRVRRNPSSESSKAAKPRGGGSRVDNFSSYSENLTSRETKKVQIKTWKPVKPERKETDVPEENGNKAVSFGAKTRWVSGQPSRKDPSQPSDDNSAIVTSDSQRPSPSNWQRFDDAPDHEKSAGRNFHRVPPQSRKKIDQFLNDIRA